MANLVPKCTDFNVKLDTLQVILSISDIHWRLCIPKNKYIEQNSNLRSSRTAKQTLVFYQPLQPHSPRNSCKIQSRSLSKYETLMSDMPHFWAYKTHSDTTELFSTVGFRTFSHTQGVALLQKSSLCHSLLPHLPRHCSVPWEGKHRAHEEPQSWAKAMSLGCCKDIAAGPFLLGILLGWTAYANPNGFGHRGLQTLGKFWIKLFEMFHRRGLLDKFLQHCKVRGSS